MTLEKYHEKRDFSCTPEPAGDAGSTPSAGESPLRFIIQKHHARTLHYDLRLEYDGALKSWAVPKGPSLDPAEKRLAVEVEDHPLEYGDFEGSIPEGEYGAGKVIVWDRGIFEPAGEGETFGEMIGKGVAKIRLSGEKLRGRYALVRTRWGGKAANWLLIKEKDEHARPGYDVTAEEPLSVLSGRDVDEVD
ncbi:MAG: DNA polymerase ligase N-terminal domain-containing protein [Geobacteraceae bacterium]|nr:DNA polymerase ligase N-terminal domain-containing protein [Geobacteraceae bacterium]